MMSVYVQFTPYALRDGGGWDAQRDALCDTVLPTVATTFASTAARPHAADAFGSYFASQFRSDDRLRASAVKRCRANCAHGSIGVTSSDAPKKREEARAAHQFRESARRNLPFVPRVT